MFWQRFLCAAVILVLSSVFAEAADKGEYYLFKPTPVELMRDMSTDRPDRTESPYTVDAGHIQVETSLLDYTYEHHNPDEPQVRTDNFSFIPSNLKVGLLNNTDLQIVLEPFIHEYSRDDGSRSEKSGFGDIQTRLKVNVWGNDGGATALAVMPFIKFPTNNHALGKDDSEGGVIIPLGVALPADWNMGVMSEFDFNKNAEDHHYHTEYVQSITFSHTIVGELSGYVEFFSNVSAEEKAKWVSTVDIGLTYAVSKDLQLDMGVNIGTTAAAEDLNPFCGLSWRY